MIRAFRRSLLAAACVLAGAPLLSATDLHVPSQYATIQQAMFAASPGDRVLVAPGTYPEAIDYLGKGIEVIGVGGAAVTTIDATGIESSCVRFMANEPQQALLQGFTLTGGSGSNPGFGIDEGGGIHVRSGARPVIRDCVITGNSAPRGGGFAASVLFSDTQNATLVDCVITGNQTTGSGGGVSVTFTGTSSPPFGDTEGQPVFQNCTISDNVSASAGGGVSGGGVFLDCWIAGNSARFGGGAYGVTLFERTTLIGNSATEIGGGYYGFDEEVTALAGATLIENSAEHGGGAFLDVFEFPDDSQGFPGPKFASVTGCVFARNTASVAGDGLYVFGAQLPTTTITNCSFDADAVVSTGGTLVIRNTISRGVASPFSVPGAITVRFSDVEGGWPGIGNIDADPLWVDPGAGDYELQPCSPCINAGDPTSPLDRDGSPADMGALPYHPWTDLGGGVPGTFGQALLEGTGPLAGGDPIGIQLTNAAPSTPVALLIGISALGAPFKGGTLWPNPTVVIGGPSTNASGTLQLSSTWPGSIPCGFSVYMQVWWPDAGAVAGFAGSNGLRGTTP